MQIAYQTIVQFRSKISSLSVPLLVLLTLSVLPTLAIASPAADNTEAPTISDPDFVVQTYVSGLCCNPTTIGFEDNGVILVLQKITGEVHVVHDGVFDPNPVLKENVTSVGEQGMLSIATAGKKVYLYFSESASNGPVADGKRIYSYDWTGTSLVNRTLVKDFPQTQTYHNGGAMTFDKNGSLYIVL